MATRPSVPKPYHQLFQGSLFILPLASYLGLAGLVTLLVGLIGRMRRSSLGQPTRLMLLAIAALLILSSLFAENRVEALKNLPHFLPFLLLFTYLPYVLNDQRTLEQAALALLLSSIPINLLAFGEYVLRSNWLPAGLAQLPGLEWVRSRPHVGRAMVMFDHPNNLANYLVLMLGLGLGLALCRSYYESVSRGNETTAALFNLRLETFSPLLLYTATYLNLLGIFGSGSRNGLLVGISQIAIFSLLTRASRRLILMGALGIAAILAGATLFGIGGRSLAVSAWLNDPRVAVWRLAIDLIRQRPWLGWGLGNFKLQYPPGLIPDYDFIAHAHNIWVSLAVEAGIPLMLLFSAFVGQIAARNLLLLWRKTLKPSEQAILLAYLLSLWGCIAFALFDVTYFDSRINTVNWVVLAGLYSIQKSFRVRSTNESAAR